MNAWQKWLFRFSRPLDASEVLRLTAFSIILVVVILAMLLPLSAAGRREVLIAAGTGLAYALLIWTPFLPGRQDVASAAPYLLAVTNALYFSFVVCLFHDQTPLVALVYLLPIAGVAIRRGLLLALWSALLSSAGYAGALAYLGVLTAHFNDLAVFLFMFLAIGLFANALGQTIQRRARDYENVVTYSREAIFILDAEGRFEYLNPAAVALGGYTLQELRGRTFFDFIVPEDQARARQMWDALRAGGRYDETYRSQVVTKSGVVRILAVTLSPFDSKPPRFLVAARDVTAHDRERAAHARHLRELQAERAVALAISQTLDLQELLQIALDQSLAALQLDAGAIYLANEEQTELMLVSARHLPDEFLAPRLGHRFGESITGAAAAERRAILVTDCTQDPRVFPVAKTMPVLSQISAPLLWQDRVLGVLNVNGFGARQFSEEDVALVQTIAASIAVAIHNAQLFGTLEGRVEERTQELAALNRIAAASSRSLDLDEILIAALGELTRTLRVRGAWVRLYDPQKEELFVRAELDQGQVVTERARPLRIGEGLSGRVMQTGRACAVNLEDSDLSNREAMLARGWRSMAAVPLISEGQIIGVLGVTCGTRDRFGEAELGWLGAVGNTIAVAIKNASLYESAVRASNRRTVLHWLSQEIVGASLDLEHVCVAIHQAAAKLMPSEAFTIALLDETRDEIEGIYLVDRSGRVPLQRIPKQQGLSGHVIATGQSLRIDDLEREGNALDVIHLGDPVHVRSILAVPLRWRGRIFGMLSAQSYAPNAYTSEDLDLLETLASYAAIALENARLFEQEQRRGEEAETLRRAGAAVAATLQPQQAVERILQQLERVVPYDSASVQLLHEGYLEIVGGRGWQDLASVIGIRFPVPGDNPNSIVIQLRQPYLLGDAPAAHAPFREKPHNHIRSWLGVPLIVRDRVIGMLAVDSMQPNFFTETHARLASAFANQVAIALENARLFESVEQQVRQLATLRDIDRTLNSMLDLEPMLETLLSRLEQIVPYESAAVLLLDGTLLRAVAARGQAAAALNRFAFDTADNSIFRRMVETRAFVLLENVGAVPDWVPVPGMEAMCAWLGAPLIARDQVIGQIGLFHTTAGSFTAEHGHLLVSFANHAAIAIANARLRAELREQARRDSLTQALTHGVFIEELRAAAAHAQHRRTSLAMIMLDVDFFKQYNDTYGHVVGDTMLTMAVQAIRQHIEQTDLFGRWGGEEFAVVLRDADTARARLVAERIRRTLAAMQVSDRHGNPVPPPTVSQGIAALPETARDADELIEQADRALYRAKAQGRDQIACAKPLV